MKSLRRIKNDSKLLGGTVLKAASVDSRDGSPLVKSVDGEEVDFVNAKDDDDEMIARSVLADRMFMHAVAVVNLPAAANITLEDLSDVEQENPMVTGRPAGDP